MKDSEGSFPGPGFNVSPFTTCREHAIHCRMTCFQPGCQSDLPGSCQHCQVVTQIHKAESGDLDRISVFQKCLRADGFAVQIERPGPGNHTETMPVPGHQKTGVFKVKSGGDPYLVLFPGSDPDAVEAGERDMKRRGKQ